MPALASGLFAAREAWSGPRAGPNVAPSRPRSGRRVRAEYAAVRDPGQWTAEEPQAPLERAVALVAARAGAVRLIDNLDLGEG